MPAGCVLLSFLVAGCAVTVRDAADVPTAPSAVTADDFPRSRLVASDFVDAMVQLPELEPARTTLYAERPASRFGQLFVASLQEAGYDLRLGDEGTRATLGYRVLPERDTESDADAARYTFLIEAGAVRLGRTYRVDVAGVRPSSPMRVHGADARALASGTAWVGEPDASTEVRLAKVPLTRSARVASAPPAAPPAARPVDTALKRNLFETGRSNYADQLAGYATLTREVMVFPNDSLRMGAANKRRARALARAFDPARDVISVIGCSHGRTALVNGNETLATGRSYRVKEELMLAGIAPDRVLEEGCWASEAHESMPARGVVVTHKRRAAG